MKFLTTTEAARILKVPREYAADLCVHKNIQSFKVNGRWHIVPRSLKRYAQRREVRQEFFDWMYLIKRSQFVEAGGDSQFYDNFYHGWLPGLVRKCIRGAPFTYDVDYIVSNKELPSILPYFKQQTEIYHEVRRVSADFDKMVAYLTLGVILSHTLCCKENGYV